MLAECQTCKCIQSPFFSLAFLLLLLILLVSVNVLTPPGFGPAESSLIGPRDIQASSGKWLTWCGIKLFQLPLFYHFLLSFSLCLFIKMRMYGAVGSGLALFLCHSNLRCFSFVPSHFNQTEMEHFLSNFTFSACFLHKGELLGNLTYRNVTLYYNIYLGSKSCTLGFIAKMVIITLFNIEIDLSTNPQIHPSLKGYNKTFTVKQNIFSFNKSQ